MPPGGEAGAQAGGEGGEQHIVQDGQGGKDVKMGMMQVCSEIPRQVARQVPKQVSRVSIILQHLV